MNVNEKLGGKKKRWDFVKLCFQVLYESEVVDRLLERNKENEGRKV